MISDNDHTIIDQYLKGLLTGKELDDFNQRLKSDSHFAEEFSLMSDIVKGIRTIGKNELKDQIRSVINKKKAAKNKVIISWVIGIAASFVIVIGCALWMLSPDNPFSSSSKQNFTIAPLTSVTVPSHSYTISVKNNHFKLSTGEFIDFSGGTFKDSHGNAVKEKVNVSCKSLTNPFDQFVAGIPSTALNKKYLKPETIIDLSELSASSGIVSLSGAIQVVIPARDTISNMILKLDTISKTWIACGEDSVFNIDKYALNNIPPDIVVPRLEDKSKPRFKITINENQFPELSQYNNYIFEIAPQEKNYDPSDDQMIWKNIVVKKGNPGEPYQVTLKNDTKTVTYQVFPVFAKEYYAQAMKVYNERLANYNATLYKGEELKRYNLANLIRQNFPKSLGNNFRVFSLTNHGIYTNAHYINTADNRTVHVVCTDQQGNKLNLSQIAIADFSNRIIRRVKTGDKIKLSFNDSFRNGILAITSDNQLAYLTPGEFNQVLTSDQPSGIRLHIVDPTGKSYNKLKQVFSKDELAIVLSFQKF